MEILKFIDQAQEQEKPKRTRKKREPAPQPQEAPAPQQEPTPAKQSIRETLLQVAIEDAAEALEGLEGLTLSRENPRLLWIDGNTLPHKEIIKTVGGRWFPTLKKWYVGDIKTASGKKSADRVKTELEKKLQELAELDGINASLKGNWIWIDGDTKPHKEQLKKIGCRWASNKKKWFYMIDSRMIG